MLTRCNNMTERMLYGMYSSWVRNDYCVISILTLFIVIAAARPVNKNVNTGAVKSKTMYRSRRAFINWRTRPRLYQTGGYKFRPMSGWNETIGSRSGSAFQFITHPLYPRKHDD